MVFHSIFNEGDFMMNKFVILAMILLMSALISCEDSLGIDPNVHKNPIFNDPGDDDNNPGDDSPIYEIRKKDWYYAETIFLQGNQTQNFEWYNNVNYQRNSCKIDTTADDYYLWIDLDAECTYPDAVISNRNDRITGVRILLDSLKFPNGISALDKRDIRVLNSLRFKLYVKDLSSGSSTYYTDEQLHYSYMFEIDRTRRIISFNMIIWLLYMFESSNVYDTEALQIKADFHYGQ